MTGYELGDSHNIKQVRDLFEEIVVKTESACFRMFIGHTPDNGGFTFFGEDGESFEDTLIVDVTGWAAFDGIRHYTSYWYYPDWDLINKCDRLLIFLQKNICTDETGERISRDKYLEVINQAEKLFSTVY
jgi:hypothetical protein